MSAELDDAIESDKRAQWLFDHKAPLEWVILTRFEIGTIKTEMAALRDENARLKGLVEQATRTNQLHWLDEYNKVNATLSKVMTTLGETESQLAALTAEAEKLRGDAKAAKAQNEWDSKQLSKLAVAAGVNPERVLFVEETEVAINLLVADAKAAKEREEGLRRALEGTYELANSIAIYPYDKQDRILRQARKALAGEGA